MKRAYLSAAERRRAALRRLFPLGLQLYYAMLSSLRLMIELRAELNLNSSEAELSCAELSRTVL